MQSGSLWYISWDELQEPSPFSQLDREESLKQSSLCGAQEVYPQDQNIVSVNRMTTNLGLLWNDVPVNSWPEIVSLNVRATFGPSRSPRVIHHYLLRVSQPRALTRKFAFRSFQRGDVSDIIRVHTQRNKKRKKLDEPPEGEFQHRMNKKKIIDHIKKNLELASHQ